MSGNDLYSLVTGYTKWKAKAEATTVALETERNAHMEYARDVGILMELQAEERAEYQSALKAMERRLNAPALELYGGYNTERQWEGGLRLVIRLR